MRSWDYQNYKAPDKAEQKYPNGKYENASYHHANSSGSNNTGKSPAPKDGQKALDNSIQIKDTSVRRIGVSDGQIVVLDQTVPGTFHGHVRTFEELVSAGIFDEIIAEIFEMGLIDKKGRPLL